ncbi:MAG: fluoride efflux transporter CrcB [Betaproteobacteria bacterium]|nr:fluoride efflux transporter CrcB [Betaproteobacteria bacterium]
MNALLLQALAVGGGAALGAWTRWGLGLWLNSRVANFPLGTFAANAIGGLLVGIAVAHFSAHESIPPVWRLFVITGLLGGLTTFSTYSAEVVGLLERGLAGWALAVGLAHLMVSFALTAAGIWGYRALA